MKNNISVSDIFNKLKKVPKKEQKLNIIQEYGSPMLASIIQLAYHDNVKWLLPKGVPPYKCKGDAMSFDGIYKKLKMFIKGGGYDNWNNIKREMKFIEYLEMLSPDDAKILLQIKDGALVGLTKEMFNKMGFELLSEPFNTIIARLK